MNIAQIIPTLGPGGAEAFCVDLAVAFAEAGHGSSIHVLCNARGERGAALKARAEAAGVSVHINGALSPKAWSALRVTARLLTSDALRAVICHLPSSEVLALGPSMLAKRGSSKLLRVLHNTRRPRGIYAVLEGALRTTFDASVACSKEVFEAYPLSGRGSLRWIDNGVDLERIGPIISPPRREHGRLKLAMIGSARFGLIGGQKGIDTAIEALATAGHEASIDLTITGCPARDHDAIRKYAENLGVSSRVQIRPEFADVRAEICSIEPDAMLLPSRFEGLPIALLEYSCLGIPCITSNLPQVQRLAHPAFLWRMFDAGSAASLAAAYWTAVQTGPQTHSTTECYAHSARNLFSMRMCAKAYEQIIAEGSQSEIGINQSARGNLNS